MLFNSSVFIVFLILVFALYWMLAPKRPVTGRVVLLAASYLFYGWWDWRFLVLIAFSSATDFFIGKWLYQTDLPGKRKMLLFFSLLQNIGILFIFKYLNFFIDSFRELFGMTDPGQWTTLHIILPVGISFYTFQTLSYTLDIYFKRLEPTRSALTFFTFVSFFPQLVAGPIERAVNLIPQFGRTPQFSYDKAASGLKLMLWGFFKKMVIADQLAGWVNLVYGQPDIFSGPVLIITTFAFGYQIYCDFSGYSDIAVGTARLFGIDLMVNFRTPYFAQSVRDFWKRWHISLSSWFRDYLYIPLGGSKTGRARWIFNVMATFTVSGLWHGAAFTFVVWGAAHGILYIAEHLLAPKYNHSGIFRKLSGWIATFILVHLCWIPFRAESWQDFKLIISKLHDWEKFSLQELQTVFLSDGMMNETGRMLLFAMPFFLLVEYACKKMAFEQIFATAGKTIRWSFYYIILLMILFLGVLKSAPEFIYFQF